jgi:hypothetical protein
MVDSRRVEAVGRRLPIAHLTAIWPPRAEKRPAVQESERRATADDLSELDIDDETEADRGDR